MPLHTIIIPKSTPTQGEFKLDLTEKELDERILAPYREGRPIVIGGRTIPPDDIGRIQIIVTKHSSDNFTAFTTQFARRGHRDWFESEQGIDVTDDFIKGPPGTGILSRQQTAGPDIQGPRVVFVVHGRNLDARNALFTFLRSIGLHPLEWSEAVLATGKTSPYIGEILDKAFEIAQAIVVLMTPDDEARLREPFRQSGDPPHETELTPQSRPNVIFEAGMAMGRCADRTVLAEIGNLRPFSDVGGRHVIKLNDTTQKRQEFAQRLQSAGCPVNLSGTDWHTAGVFNLEDES